MKLITARFAGVAVVVALSAPVATAQTREMQLLVDAASALGGRARIESVKTLTIEGYGANPNVGQNMTPESELLLWMIPDYRRSIDLEHGRMGLQFTRRPAFPAVFDNFGQQTALDGNVAYNLPVAGRGGGAGALPTRVSAEVARERRVEMLHHPLTAVRAGLTPGATLSNLRQVGSNQSVDIRTVGGERVTLTVDALKRPVSVASMSAHTNLGDVQRVTRFGAYEDVDGVRLPKRLVTTVDRWVEWDIGVMTHTLDSNLDNLAAPVTVLNAPVPPAIPPQNVPVTDVSPGIWYLTGAGVPSLVVEFADHVTLVEVPGSEARTRAVIAKARELVPGKPLTQAVVTHHHFDHAGGLRAAVAEGLTIVTHRVNEAWFREMVRRTHSILPDALARNPQPLKIVTVDDAYVVRDASMEMDLFHLVGSTHGDGILSAYFPAQKVYAEPDVWNPGAQIQPHVRSLYADILRRGLSIDRIVPLHGNAVQPVAEFLKIVQEWTGLQTGAAN